MKSRKRDDEKTRFIVNSKNKETLKIGSLLYHDLLDCDPEPHLPGVGKIKNDRSIF